MKNAKDKPEEYTGDILQNQFTAYVDTALKNNRISYFRKQQAKQKDLVYFASEEELPILVHTEETNSASNLIGLRNEGLLHAINQLSEKDLIIIRLRVLYRYSYKKIATVLGITVNAANVRYVRAIAKLRKILEDYNDIP